MVAFFILPYLVDLNGMETAYITLKPAQKMTLLVTMLNIYHETNILAHLHQNYLSLLDFKINLDIV